VGTITSAFSPPPEGAISPGFIRETLLTTEEATHLIRGSTDHLISLWSILSDFSKNRAYSEKIKIDCVRSLLDDIRISGANHELSQHRDWLEKLNEVANAYKHSFLLLQGPILATDQPRVAAVSWPRNNIKNPPKFYGVPLVELMAGFDRFHQTIATWLKQWYAANPGCHNDAKYNSDQTQPITHLLSQGLR
jgi:hypothetical protein